MDHLLTPEEAAEHLKITVETLRKHLRMGKIAGAFKIGRLWRIPLEGLAK